MHRIDSKSPVTRDQGVMTAGLLQAVCAAVVALSLLLLPSLACAAPESFAIELKPRSVGKKITNNRARLQRGAGGDAVDSALERIRGLADKGDPVAQGAPTTPGKLKADESGTPGLGGKESFPKQAGGPQLPNSPGQPPKPQSQLPQICQQILGLIQQLAGSQGQSGQSGSPPSSSSIGDCAT